MDAHEAIAELFLQRLQWFLDQVLAAGMVHDHVFFLGLQVVHLLDRDHPQAAAQASTQLGAPGAFLLRARSMIGAYALQCGRQPLRSHRLDQVVQRGSLERGQGVLVIGGAEHHRRRRNQSGQPPRGLQPVQAGHGDIQQHGMRMQRCAGIEHLLAIASLGHHLHPGLVGKQHSQALARQRLVIGDHQLQDGHQASGSVTSQA